MAWNKSLIAQYRAATSATAMLRLPEWSTVTMRGGDRASFLHNMCTNDIRSLSVGQQCEAFLTDVKGKIVAHVIVFVASDRLILITVPHQAERIVAHLDRYIIREDVQLVDESANTSWSIMAGPSAAPGGSQALPASPNNSGLFSADCVQIWTRGAWLGAWGEPADNDVAVCDDAIWRALRLESGWPLFGVDFDGSNLPQEVGRNAQAINFRKGCYLGQETIARIDALGHVNKRLAAVRLSGEAAPGDELFAGEELAGRISSASYSPRLGAWLALAMVRRGHNEPGVRLTCRNLEADIVPTPAVHLAPGQ